MAALTAAQKNKVILIEKNDRIGKKLFITGKGRCNVTNACDADGFFNSVVTNRASVVYKYNTKGQKKKKDANCSDSGRKRTNIALIFCPLLTSLP